MTKTVEEAKHILSKDAELSNNNSDRKLRKRKVIPVNEDKPLKESLKKSQLKKKKGDTDGDPAGDAS